jgi:hypothetical protein
VSETARRWAGDVSSTAIVVLVLSLFTYLSFGYRYGVWPQPGLLESVYALHGQLRNDWFSALPPVHWVLANVLGTLPLGALPDAIFVLWVIGLFALWASVAWLARLLGAGAATALGVGLVTFSTSLAGVGGSVALLGLMYPTTLAFAIGVAAIPALAADRPGLAGALIGLSTAAHPNVGALLLVVIGPAALLLPSRVRGAIRLVIGFAVIGAFPLLHVVLDKAVSNSLPQTQAFDLMVVVRNPHHALYRVFPATEYIHTAGWLVVLAIGLPLVAQGLARRVVACIAGCTVALAVAGGIASELRHPFFMVELLTSRVTPVIVLLGIVTGLSALFRVFGLVSIVVAAAAFEAAHVLAPIGSADKSAVEAGVIAIALAAAHLAHRRGYQPDERHASIAIGVAVAALAIASITILRADGWKTGQSPAEMAWRQMANRTAMITPIGSIILTPPDLDGFRFFARRAIVVDFGEFPFGRGTGEWSRRLVAVTGDPAIVTDRLPPDAYIRSAQMAVDYDRQTARSPRAACAYGAGFVVTRASALTSPWAKPLFRNAYYVLSRVKEGTCVRKAGST